MYLIGNALSKGIHLLNSVFNYICVILLFVMMVLGTADVIGRYLFNSPILGTLEIFEILLPAIVLLGLGYTQQNRGHVTIDLLVVHLSHRNKILLEIITSALALLVSAMILWRGWILTAVYWRMHRTIATIDVPMFIPQSFVPLGALLLCIVLLVQLIDCLKQLTKRN